MDNVKKSSLIHVDCRAAAEVECTNILTSNGYMVRMTSDIGKEKRLYDIHKAVYKNVRGFPDTVKCATKGEFVAESQSLEGMKSFIEENNLVDRRKKGDERTN